MVVEQTGWGVDVGQVRFYLVIELEQAEWGVDVGDHLLLPNQWKNLGKQDSWQIISWHDQDVNLR